MGTPKWLQKLKSSYEDARQRKTEKQVDPAKRKKRFQLAVFLILAVFSFALCFSLFGIVPIGSDPNDALNLLVFLWPVIFAVCFLGAGRSLFLALLTGLFIMFRCQWSPTTQFDNNLCDPFLSVVSILVATALMIAIVHTAKKRWPVILEKDKKPWQRLPRQRIIAVIAGCLVFSFAFSYFARGVVYLVIKPGGEEYGYASMVESYIASLTGATVFWEAFFNGILNSILCLVALWYKAEIMSGTRKRSLRMEFNRWFVLAMIVVFVVASSISYCTETANGQSEADGVLQGELEYMKQQAEDRVKANVSVQPLAEGYNTVYGGTIAIIHDGKVVSSNNPEDLGKDARRLVSSGGLDNYDFLIGLACDHMLIGYDDEIGYSGLRALSGDDGYQYIIYSPLSAMYKARTATLRYNAVFTLILQIIVFVLAHWLLKTVIVKPIQRTNETLEEITEGDLTRRVEECDVKELDSLSAGINATVSALGATIAEVEQRNARDLATAKTIQESALPRTFPPFPEIEAFDIYASMNAAKEVGGDFYDFFIIDERTLGFLIADVSGKGIPGALFMMAAKTEIENYMTTGMDLAQAILSANRHLCANNDAGMFVTVWAATLNWETGEMTYVNAGHNPPLLRHGEEWEWLTKRGGLFLGTFDTAKYRSAMLMLEPGDQIVLYTDGVNEAFNVDEEEYGNDRLEAFLADHADLHPRELVVALRKDVADWATGAEQSDDITILSLEYGDKLERREHLIVPAEVTQLAQVYAFVHDEMSHRDAPKSARYALDTAVEELFCNVCHYAYPKATVDNPGEVRIALRYDEGETSALTVTMEDDGIPFDPLSVLDVATPTTVDDMLQGGLGIRMANNSLDSMEYRREGDTNVLVMHKSW